MRNFPVALKSLLPLVLLIACGPQEESASAEVLFEGPVCPLLTGAYETLFVLQKVEGKCDRAFTKASDPLEFDAAGQLVPPIANVVTCETVQEGCRLVVRCTSAAMGSRASIDAEISPDGQGFTGQSVVDAAYNGCNQVVYEVSAQRLPPVE